MFFGTDLRDRKVSLLFSGGVESTLLLYLLMKDNIKFDTYIIDRFNNPLNKATRVFNYIKKLTNSTGELTTLTFPKLPQHLELINVTMYLSRNHDIILWGINKYPLDQSIRPNHIFNFQETDKLKLPFKDLEKSQTVEAFYKLGIEHLLPITHSCGSALNTPCGECFNCRERTWAYNKLGLTTNLGC
jgi:7-cyano-7-deazaguanine synthase in queuosine biosynthesis